MAKKILLVDDEVDLVELLKIRLESNGYDVLAAHNGKECLHEAKANLPDLIILDVLMPEMDGYTTLRELKKEDETKDIPVIILTAKGKMRDLFEVEGIDDYMVKPFDDDELLLRIKRALDQQQ